MTAFRQLLFILICGHFSLAQADFSSSVSVENQSFLKKPGSPVAQNEGAVEAEFQAHLKNSSGAWGLRLHPWARQNSAAEVATTQTEFDLKEAQIQWRQGSWQTGLGFFTPSWEGTDGVNPMDLASMKSLRDPLRSRSLSSAGLHLGFSRGSWEAEAFAVPQQTRSQIPGARSAWWPRALSLPLQTETLILRLPTTVGYEILESEELNQALKNNAGLRLQYRGDSFDFAVAGFEGAADTPSMRVSVEGTFLETSPERTVVELISPVKVRPVFYRRRSGAFLLALPLGETLFRMSLRHDQPLGTDTRLPGWSQQGVLGFERSVEIAGDSVVVILQGAAGKKGGGSQLTGVSDLFEQAALFGFRWPVGDNWVIFFSGFRDLKKSSSYGRLEITRRLGDILSLTLSGEALEGPPESLLGVLSDRDRVGLKLTAQF